jgi:hypothetical protein
MFTLGLISGIIIGVLFVAWVGVDEIWRLYSKITKLKQELKIYKENE